MTAAFLIVWALYTVHAIFRNARPSSQPNAAGHILQFVLLVLALWWATRNGLFTRTLWSPIDIVAGLLLGRLLFSVSLLITHRHAGDVLRHLGDMGGISAFVKRSPELVFRFAGVCVIEELVYRVGAQDMLAQHFGHHGVAIVVTALCFCVLHPHFFRNGWAGAFEFLLFSLTIGVVYYYTYSLTIVTLAHLVRNTESAYLEYCVLLEENRSEEEALHILGTRHASPAMESP